jgi:hypothetical protein
MRVFIPDQTAPLNLPGEGLSGEEVKRALVNLGYANLENATYTVDANGDIRFNRPVGGDKGC